MSNVRVRYEELLAAGVIVRDPVQQLLVERLAQLAVEVEKLATQNSWMRWPLGRRRQTTQPKGLYIWGRVGGGKTMLADLLFENVAIPRKRRTHFADFMADVHERVHSYQRHSVSNNVIGGDPIALMAGAIVSEAQLICLDEFHVDDIADAMILSRLFAELFNRGLVVVMTSNTRPDDLYAGGLNRALFLPFLVLLKKHLEIICLKAARDYRLDRLGIRDVYFSPADADARHAMNVAWKTLTGADRGNPTAIETKGRRIAVPEAVSRVARFSFTELCRTPLGANDYLKLARTFHTLFVDGVPILTSDESDAARRLMFLVDALYDHHVKLVMSADAEPDALCAPGAVAAGFQRTASRLYEMRSLDYLSEFCRRVRNTTGTSAARPLTLVKGAPDDNATSESRPRGNKTNSPAGVPCSLDRRR